MKVAVVGSRDFPDLAKVEAVMDEIIQNELHIEIVSGGARGVDQEAERIARGWSTKVIVIPAEWDKFGKGAGMIRNRQIVELADRVIAFWDGESPGTRNTIGTALKAKKNLEVIFP